MVNILTINSILVNIDIISGSYVNGSTKATIDSFFPDVSPGYKIIENSHNLLYLPITSDTIHSITIWLTDQNRKELNWRGKICQCDFIWERFEKNILSFKNDTIYNFKIPISEGQKDKLKEAFESNYESITIRFKFSECTLLSKPIHNLTD